MAVLVLLAVLQMPSVLEDPPEPEALAIPEKPVALAHCLGARQFSLFALCDTERPSNFLSAQTLGMVSQEY